MDRNREKRLPVFINPFAAWTELALRMWGFGRSDERPSVPANPVAVAVIPASDAPAPSAPRVSASAAKPESKVGRKPAKRSAKAAKSSRSSAGRTGRRRPSTSAQPGKAKRRSGRRAGR